MEPLDPSTLSVIAAFWTSELGCSPDAGTAERVEIVAHGLAWSGALAFRRGAGCILSVPPAHHDAARHRAAGLSPEVLFTEATLRQVFAASVERVIGPAYLGYVDNATFVPVPPAAVRQLEPSDAPALDRLRAACEPEAWEHSSVEMDMSVPTFGYSKGNAIIAAGVLQPWSAGIVNLGIVTHPAHRGAGYGRAVVSTMTRYALDIGQVPQYRTLTSNTPSMNIARALGYQEYARTLAARLVQQADS